MPPARGNSSAADADEPAGNILDADEASEASGAAVEDEEDGDGLVFLSDDEDGPSGDDEWLPAPAPAPAVTSRGRGAAQGGRGGGRAPARGGRSSRGGRAAAPSAAPVAAAAAPAAAGKPSAFKWKDVASHTFASALTAICSSGHTGPKKNQKQKASFHHFLSTLPMASLTLSQALSSPLWPRHIPRIRSY